MSAVTFLGGGSFGTALSLMLSKKGYTCRIWDRNINVVNDININKKNSKYLKEAVLNNNITAYTDMKEAVDGCGYLVLSVPSHVIRSICRKVSEYIKNDVIVVNIAKGIEEGSNKRLSTVIKEELPNNPVVVLSGPSHAEEVAIDVPTAIVVSSTDMKYAIKVQDLFMTDRFRVYTNDDVIGIEIGGAVKNIIALAAGISDGIGCGDNTKAALMTRGMSEIIRIGTALGGRKETFYGLSGMGDLIVTCTSMHSRNRRAGILIGKGVEMNEACKEIGMVVEGIKACRAFYELKKKENISMPITDTLYNVLFNGMNPKEAVRNLMTRNKKDEI